ncbi:MAG: hypothetical protein K9J13_04905 [Saprospiraceae bacterium]|nr:hypothetical protein [Saprospiraceae bacterium]
MNKAFFRYIFSFIIVFSVLISLTTCRKDPDMQVTIYVKMRNDTLIVVPEAKVILTKQDVEIVGYTDYNGKFTHTFKLQMQLDVFAEKDTSENGTAPILEGYTILKMGELGKDYRRTVFIN